MELLNRRESHLGGEVVVTGEGLVTEEKVVVDKVEEVEKRRGEEDEGESSRR